MTFPSSNLAGEHQSAGTPTTGVRRSHVNLSFPYVQTWHDQTATGIPAAEVHARPCLSHSEKRRIFTAARGIMVFSASKYQAHFPKSNALALATTTPYSRDRWSRSPHKTLARATAHSAPRHLYPAVASILAIIARMGMLPGRNRLQKCPRRCACRLRLLRRQRPPPTAPRPQPRSGGAHRPQRTRHRPRHPARLSESTITFHRRLHPPGNVAATLRVPLLESRCRSAPSAPLREIS
jgi:hypothetical protein